MHLNEIRYALEAAQLPVPDGLTYAVDILEAADDYVRDDPTKALDTVRASVDRQKVKPADLAKLLDKTAVTIAARAERLTAADAARKTARTLGREAVVAEAPQLLALLRARFDHAIFMLRTTLEPNEQTGLRGLNMPSPYRSQPSTARDEALRELSVVQIARRGLAAAGYGPGTETGAWYTQPTSRDQLMTANQMFAHATADSFVGLLEWGIPTNLNTDQQIEAVDQLAAMKQPRDLLAS